MHVLAEVGIADLEQFLEVFRTDGLAKRAEHGCLGTVVYRVPGEDHRVVVILEFPDAASFEAFRTDPTAPPIMRRGGAQGPPSFTPLEEVARLEH